MNGDLLSDTSCPACGMGALRCLIKDAERGRPCCGDCLAQPRQRPVHVWIGEKQ